MAFLPVTDRVFFCDAEQDPEKGMLGFGAWQKVVEVVGHRMRPEDIYPPRYFVDGFPTEAEFEAIGLER